MSNYDLEPRPGVGGDFAKGASGGGGSAYDQSAAGLGSSPTFLAPSSTASATAGGTTIGTHAGRPVTAAAGTGYYESDTGVLFTFDGSTWIPTGGRLVAGVIPAAGTTPTLGGGFTYTHTNGTGIYVFTFTSAFAATPAITVTSNGIRASNFLWSVTGQATTGFTVNTWVASTAVAADAPFDFAARAVPQ